MLWILPSPWNRALAVTAALATSIFAIMLTAADRNVDVREVSRLEDHFK
jgi:hypothetical protein